MSGEQERITEQYLQVRAHIGEACARSGREESEVTVIGVTKTKPAATARAALDAGILNLGENYVQEILAKKDDVPADARWHFIGHLQRNKVKYLAPFVYMIHGVDSERLAREIDKQAAKSERKMPILLQVNTSGEESKFGCDPDDALALAEVIAGCEHLDFQGLMTLAAFLDDPEGVRPMFALLRNIRENLRSRLGLPLPHLSMGMTNDYSVAVEEGATLVRIGTALFGARS